MKVKTVVEFKPDELNQLINALENLRTLAKQTREFDYDILDHFETADDFVEFLDDIEESVRNLG